MAKSSKLPRASPRAKGETVERFGGKLALPPFIESHVHLDACLTAGDPAFNLSGTLFEGISLWSRRKEKLTKQDVRERVLRAAQMLCRNGVQYVRTHVDVTDPKLTAMKRCSSCARNCATGLKYKSWLSRRKGSSAIPTANS